MSEKIEKAEKTEKPVGNMHDYLFWRGDLKFSQSEFNEVDNLILCKLAMIDLQEIEIPEGGISLSSLKPLYLEKYGDGENLGVILNIGIINLFMEAADSVRFSEVKVLNYVNKIDKSLEVQFSATDYELNDGTRFIAYKGTDDTIIGFKEDFNMSIYDSVPAQEDARLFLQSVCESYKGKLRIGGHSKGGNLSVYAAKSVSPEIQDQIIKIYNNDGPGFKAPICAEEGYKRIKGKIINIVPEYSIVGILLNQPEDLDVVKSSAKGLYAHNGFTWEVMGAGFVRAEGLAVSSQIFDKALYAFEDNLSAEEKKELVDIIFDMLFSTGSDTLTELVEKGVWENLKSLKFFSSEERKKVLEPAVMLIKEYFKIAGEIIPERVKDKLPDTAVEAVKHPFKAIEKAFRNNDENSVNEESKEI